MDNHVKLLLFFVTSFIFVAANAEEECLTISHIYEDLGCVPQYDSEKVSCPSEYNCSHIYDRPENMCHVKGTYLADGNEVDREITAGRCDHAFSCTCEGKSIKCIVPSDSCAEFWVPDFIKPDCYPKYEQNTCCSVGQICPPFNDISECNVNGVIYKEGNRFNHPDKKCTRCVCNKEFDGNLESPVCQKLNCTSELLFSSEIDNYCAPLFRDKDSCCPYAWVCPNDDGIYTSASSDSELKCKFEDKAMNLGDKYEGQNRQWGKFSCECLIPPYLSCFRKFF